MDLVKKIFLVVAWNFVNFYFSMSQDPNGLFSDINNLAKNAKISVNATCGEQESEIYCKLVEHVEISRQHCDVCDAYSNIPSQQHHITNAIDGSNHWWQSPTVTNGRQYNYVTITIDLGVIYQVAYIIIKAANSPRPGNWILEKSLDGINYKPWQYFAINSRECRKAYNIIARKGRPTYHRDDEVICTSFYSSLNPLENGEIFVSLVNGRPGVLQPSKVLLEFTSARFVRIRLQKIRTLNADLMTFRYMDPRDVDPSVTRRYFYSVKDISIGGQCLCYGHATECRRLMNSDRLACNCAHNTCGNNCEMCCPKFNQKLWQQAGNGFSGMCEECNCHGQANVCMYNATVDRLGLSLDMNGNRRGGGVCLSCRGYTTGINCEICMEGYFRPHRASLSSLPPCQQCRCPHTVGSTAVCVTDDSRLSEGLNPGDCVCHTGYAGPKCDQCVLGYFGYPRCQPCPCNRAGSINVESCRQYCICKENVEGLSCDKCKPGFYNIDIKNPEGCSRCFCFGVTDVCQSAGLGIIEISDMHGDMDGWTVTTLNNDGFTLFPRSTNGWLELRTYPSRFQNSLDRGWSVTQENIYYWQAPIKYQGNRLTSYGGNLRYRLRYTKDDTAVENYHIPAPNIIIKSGNLTITNGREYVRENIENSFTVPLLEKDWFMLHSSGQHYNQQPIGKLDFMRVLHSVEGLLIRATHHTSQDWVYLDDVVLESISAISSSIVTIPTVEKCSCPLGYGGLSCESCEPGWRRVDNVLYQGTCVLCNCHGHSKQCDQFTGQCLACDHNTFGDHCDLCKPGYYGDATSGCKDDCRPCACPLLDPANNFARTCRLSPTPGNSDSFMCLDCRQGYVGLHCERCADGYYGNPMTPGGRCQPCFCNDNIDMSVPDSCNAYTGECLRCLYNTEGPDCGKCKRGYYGTARSGDCKACDCDVFGTVNTECDVNTGQCQCKERYGGRRCDQCQFDHWGLDTGEGCKPCNCNPVGSRSHQCDRRNGQCPCKTGVAGLYCDQCETGYYDFSQYGCQECELCNRPGYVCDPLTGECVCPPYTEGVSCERCISNSWGHDIRRGCKPCNCNSQGSYTKQCDQDTGQCRCLSDYNGTFCDMCLFGMHNFPACHLCLCSVDGTATNTCDKFGNCYCDNGGQCTCKPNVEGKKCTQCKANTFSLAVDTPTGCTECFCFHRSTTCSQAAVRWTEVSVPDRALSFDPRATGDIQRHAGLFTIPDNTTWATNPQEATPHLSAALYWTLPRDILGDMTLSYNGWMTFSVFYLSKFWTPDNLPEGNGDTSSVLVMKGNGFTIVHDDHTLFYPNKMHGFIVQLHENVWMLENGLPVSRDLLMVVLQNVSDIFIRGTLDHFAYYMNLTSVHISVGEVGNHDNPAEGVEDCDCPPKYSGLSCQNPAPGYYRVQLTNTTNLSDPVVVIGEVRPCECHNHSNSCNPVTGVCEDCQGNTFGAHCDLCAPGYYGDPVRGSRQDCRACACPLQTNSFSTSCHSTPHGLLVCTNCSEGYTGDRCEHCDTGYYGQPLQPGGRCVSCDCNPEGSLDMQCDLGGQCHCQSGVSGLKCDRCRHRHAVLGGICISCDVGCTSWLMKDVDFLETFIANVSIDVVLPVPWERLFSIERERDSLREALHSIKQDRLTDLLGLASFLQQLVAQQLPRSEYVEQRGHITEDAARQFYHAALDIEDEVNRRIQDVKNITINLEEIIRNLEISRETGLNITEVLAEMRSILNEIEARDFRTSQETVTREKGLADKLLYRVKGMKDMLTNTSEVEKALNNTYTSLIDLIKHAETSKDTSNTAIFLMIGLREKILKLKNMASQMENMNRDIEQSLYEGRFFIEDGWSLLNEANNNFLKIESDSSILHHPMSELQHRESILRNQLPNAITMVDRAWNHARNISAYAEQLRKMFEAAKAAAVDPLKAASVYDDIIRAVDEAQDAANTALKEAIKSRDIAGVDNLQGDVKKSLERSEELLAQANRMLKDRIEGFDDTLREMNEDLDDIEDQQNKAKEELLTVEADLRNLPTDISDKVTDVFHHVDDISHRVNATRDKVKVILNKLDEDMRTKLLFLQNDNTTALIANAVFSVGKARKNMLDMKNLTYVLYSLSGKAQLLSSTVGNSILHIKQKIKIAQEKVNEWKPSLSADGRCIRSFTPISQSSRRNTVTFGLRINTTEDMLILLIQNSQQEFIAFELRDRKIRLTWALGSTPGTLEHSTIFHLNNDFDTTLYRVVAERMDNKATLDVYTVANHRTGDATTITNSSGAGSSIFHMDNTTDIFVAGAHSAYHLPRGITDSNFVGCVGDLHIDGLIIGMSMFKSGTEYCQACEEILGTELIREEDTYTFHGTGYASLPFSRENYRSKGITLNFEFKTFWENASIFFAGNDGSGDFMSVELVSGHVVFLYYLGGDSLGILKSIEKYNTNTWHLVSIQREELEALVVVDGVEIYGTATGKNTGLELGRSPHFYYGGIPNMDISRFLKISPIETSSFVGCLRKFIVLDKNQNIKLGETLGVTEGCSGRRIVGFYGDGFLEVNGSSLSWDKFETSLSFATEEDGLLLLAADEPTDASPQNYYSIAIRNGQLTARFSSEAEHLTLKSEQKYNDGRLHIVTIKKSNRRLELIVDDRSVEINRLPPGTTVSDSKGGKLYLGGVPVSFNVGVMATATQGFAGHISEVFIDQKIVYFYDSKNFLRADVGRYKMRLSTTHKPTSVKPQITTLAPVTTTPPTSCASDVFYEREPEAFTFGKTVGSYAEIAVRSSDVSKSFNISFEFRTFWPDGMFFYLTNIDQSDFMAALLQNGQLSVSYDHQTDLASVNSSNRIDDGEWHLIKVNKDRHKIFVEIDGKEQLSGEIKKSLNVEEPMYLGGLPDGYDLKPGLIDHSIRGCIKNFVINKELISVQTLRVSSGTGPCYKNVVTGAYFNGHSSGIINMKFTVGSTMYIVMEFRTNKPDGILMWISEPLGMPSMSLELHEGKVKFSIKHQNDRFTAETKNSNPYLYCDQKWHKIKAHVIKNVVSLQLDNGEVNYKSSSAAHRHTNTSSPLYLGNTASAVSLLNGAAFTNKGFVGCMRNIDLNGTMVDWFNLADSSGIDRTACPST